VIARAVHRYLLAFGLALAAGCSFDRAEHAQACTSDADCGELAQCYASYCIARQPVETGCSGDKLEACYDGPAASADVGACKGGQRICVDGDYSECLGQVVPSEELCNRKDDDCDGTVDDVRGSAACDTALQGACREGTLECRDGIELCQPNNESQAEVCNAIDDDCDGETDEITDGACYPEETAGCTRDDLEVWRCHGRCATGRAACSTTRESCDGAVTPEQEQCTGNGLAQDEDCDGEVDEACPCEAGAMRDCYSGPDGTRGVGICLAGTQACAGSSWGLCQGQVMPGQEGCENPNNDDDCNDVEDDVPGLGTSCVANTKKGECRKGVFECDDQGRVGCRAGEPSDELCDQLDQDCDGDPTNGFDLNSDETCGSCDRACGRNEVCCGGECIDAESLQGDAENCGACGTACGAGQYCCQADCLTMTMPAPAMCACANDCGNKACCGSDCRDLEKDKNNCGACGRKCMGGQRCERGDCRQ
jgi:hypothetical protein